MTEGLIFCTKTCYISEDCLEAIQNPHRRTRQPILYSTSVVQCSTHTCLLFAKTNGYYIWALPQLEDVIHKF